MKAPRFRVSILTPPGRGAIATVLAHGEDAVAAVERCFEPAARRTLSQADAGRILFGRWRPTGEELVVCRLDPHTVEVHTHGGDAAPRAVVEALVSLGGKEECPSDHIDRMSADSLAAEAWRALGQARTIRTTGILLDQLRGGLRGETLRLLGLVEQGRVDEARAGVDALLETAALGRRLVAPWRLAIAGRPNVGKSCLLNALVGYERAVVYDTPGVTRDVVTAPAVFDGWPVELSDTAGLRESRDPLEAEGVGRARETLASADLVLAVFDRSQPWTEQDGQVLATLPEGREKIIVHTKSDLPPGDEPGDGPRPEGVCVSGLRGEGIDTLIGHILQRLVPAVPSPGSAVVFTERQAELLRRAKRLLDLSPSEAIEALRLLYG